MEDLINPEEEIEVIKGGERIVDVSLRRSIKGLLVVVKTHPAIEELLKSWGTGEQQDIINHGREWWQVRKSLPLRVWQLGRDPGLISVENGDYFRITHCGRALLEGTGQVPRGGQVILDGPNGPIQPQGPVLNMSFLRLCGVSEGNGVSFMLREVNAPEDLVRLGNRIRDAARRFYVNYLKPARVDISVSTQVMR